MPGHAEDKLLPSTVQYQGVRSEAARNRGSPVNVGSAPVPVDGEQLKVKDGRVERGRQSVAIVAGKTVLLVLLYYVTSIGLTFYQKWLLKVSVFFLKSMKQTSVNDCYKVYFLFARNSTSRYQS